jgi:hypothetical protein
MEGWETKWGYFTPSRGGEAKHNDRRLAVYGEESELVTRLGFEPRTC